MSGFPFVTSKAFLLSFDCKLQLYFHFNVSFLSPALMLHRSTPVQIIIRGDPKTCPTAADMIAAVDSLLLPQKVFILADGNAESVLYKNLKILADISKTGKTKFIFCHFIVK